MSASWFRGVIACYFLRSVLAVGNFSKELNPQANLDELRVREFGRGLISCLAGSHKINCLETQILQFLDDAIQDNTSWQYSDFLVIENNLSRRRVSSSRHARALSFTDSIAEKLLQLAAGRTLRLQLPPQQLASLLNKGISGAFDDLRLSNAISIPINSGGFVDGVAAGLSETEEGRKKKDKDKHGGMAMGGMAMMAMVAQMFFGKVILIAGAAFVMAKIALLVSLLGSLKKGSTGSSGSTDHVIVTNAGGGGHDSPGWHRSMTPYELPNMHMSISGSPTEFTSHSLSPSSSGSNKPPESSNAPTHYNYELIDEIGEAQDDGDFKRRRLGGGFL